MKTQHTPGPWLDLGHRQIAADLVIDRPVICECRSHMGIEEADANMRLICAAPDLLAVVKELEDCAGYWSEYDVPLGIVDRLRAAIAKAEAV